jgi:hypothetical protein
MGLKLEVRFVELTLGMRGEREMGLIAIGVSGTGDALTRSAAQKTRSLEARMVISSSERLGMMGGKQQDSMVDRK